MKQFFNYIIIAFLISNISCQDEIDITEGTDPNTNNTESTTTTYLKRVSMFDGSYDDIMDKNVCSAVMLPINITANGVPLTINDSSDYQAIETIFNQSDTDEDTIEFNYPITIINYDYSEIQINNVADLIAVINDCSQLILANQSPVNCTTLTYPFNISVFSSVLDQLGVVPITSKQTLYTFLENLNDSEFYTVQYPITANVSGSESIVVNSDDLLENIIDNCIASQQSEYPNFLLNDILSQGLWEVNSFTENGNDQTAIFLNYSFSFQANDLLQITHTTLPSFNGAWNTSYLNNVTYIDTDFNNNQLFTVLNQDWQVTAMTANQVNLKSNNKVLKITKL